MKPVFDDAGLAIEAGEIRCFYYDSLTLEYTGWSDEFINIGVSMPGNSTDIDPGDEMAGKVAVFTGGVWKLEEDHRGESVWSTKDGRAVIIDYIGEIKPDFTTMSPSTPFDKWDGMQWVTDTEAQYAAAITQAENERQRLLKHADAVMLDWRTELMLGEISDANKAKLSAWLAYKNEVKSVDVTTDPEHVSWPVLPEG
ncbi:tail fiber assembly protein [Salmonella enterica]|uniref:tail fiber assembly protein n=1 Tax=Salmonella enterica TaxID=28901 RepID=UPI0009AD5CBF|nr:tail fiber assembly protein [Salmonella enterica]EAW4828612.1 tail fiber assembly protein [Salmonella enterica subsp. enterica]EAM9517181.1 tail fiber assembly protein [Salmonella enterica]EAW8463281.1 tail fiber assembly protein [Salmonella enterica]EBB0743825.1 tail fiber assembly protein [Salmonella enterica]EBV5893222.1 tail fiber assembly protein [Salmonella enterica subsp. enterica serovar Minnesota]